MKQKKCWYYDIIWGPQKEESWGKKSVNKIEISTENDNHGLSEDLIYKKVLRAAIKAPIAIQLPHPAHHGPTNLFTEDTKNYVLQLCLYP